MKVGLMYPSACVCVKIKREADKEPVVNTNMEMKSEKVQV